MPALVTAKRTTVGDTRRVKRGMVTEYDKVLFSVPTRHGHSDVSQIEPPSQRVSDPVIDVAVESTSTRLVGQRGERVSHPWDVEHCRVARRELFDHVAHIAGQPPAPGAHGIAVRLGISGDLDAEGKRLRRAVTLGLRLTGRAQDHDSRDSLRRRRAASQRIWPSSRPSDNRGPVNPESVEQFDDV